MDKCKTVLTIPQFTGTCWFNALLMTLFYSDGMRAYLTKNLINSELYKKNKGLYDIVMDILQNKYRKVNNNDAVFFNKLTPENILKLLHKADKTTFYFDPDRFSGHFGEYYMKRIFEYFGLKKKILFLSRNTDNLKQYLYSNINNDILTDFDEYKGNVIVDFKPGVKKVKDVDVLVVTERDGGTKFKKRYLTFTLDSEEIHEFIHYNGCVYKLDSLLVANFNRDRCDKGHQIAGVTCDDKRYMYNGWIRTTRGPAKSEGGSMLSYFSSKNVPCELMRYDWLKSKDDFCLSKRGCGLDKVHDKGRNDVMCFNTSNTDYSTYIYVKVEDDEKVLRLLEANLKKVSRDCKRDIKQLEKQVVDNEATTTLNLNMFNRKLRELKGQLGAKNKACSDHVQELERRITKIKGTRSPSPLPKKNQQQKQQKQSKKDTNDNKKCPKDKIINPLSGRCVLKSGKIGKRLCQQ